MDKAIFMTACRDGGDALAKALRAMLRDYGAALRHEAERCLGDAEAAADLMQQTLIKAWQACLSFRGDSELFPWLKTILRRGVLDSLRSRRDEQPLHDAAGEVLAEVEQALLRLHGQRSPEELAVEQQSERCWRACAERFEREQPQAAAVLRWVIDDGLDTAQIAELLERSPGATREYISQCRKKARVYFADWYRLLGREPG